MSASERLELEAERNRVGVAAALVELRERLRPGQLTDDVLSYAGGQTGQLLNTFGKSLAKNPVPALLIGAGIAWMFVAGREGRASSDGHRRGNGYDAHNDRPGMLKRAADSVKETASDLYDRATDTASDVGDSIADTVRAAKDRAAELGESVAGTARRAAHDTSDAASRVATETANAASRAATATAHAADDAWAFLKDQPLLLARLGLALGSAAGAVLPRTQMEDRLVGERSDRIKERGKELAADGLAAAKGFGERVLDATAEETRSQLNPAQQPAGAGSAYGSGSERGDMKGTEDRGPQTRGGGEGSQGSQGY
jgi:gas vesicle protein